MALSTFGRAKGLAKRIERDDPQCRVTGYRVYGSGGYGVEIVGTRTGIPAVIDSREQWEESVKAARFAQEHGS